MPKLPPISARLWAVDELIRDDHYHVAHEDDCYFLWEWSPALYSESATSNFIGNFQRETRFRGRNPWYYKELAIAHAATALAAVLPRDWIKHSTFVPVPPSKIKGDERHDSRLIDTLRLVRPRIADVRELVLQMVNMESRQKEISPIERANNWAIDESLLTPCPAHIVVFDDLLTGASHFAGMKLVIGRRLPLVPISGLFLARRVPTADSLGDASR